MLKRFAMPQQDLVTVYVSYIRPILEYCCVVWHSSLTLSQESQIEHIQKRALRSILGPRYESYQHALAVCNLISLKDRRGDLCFKFATLLSRDHLDWLPERQSSHRNLRHSNRFREIKCRTERYRKSALPFLVRLLNNNS